MNITSHVNKAIEDYELGYPDSAMIHVLIAIDATSKKKYPKHKKVGERYCKFLRGYYWIIEPMLVQGFNLEKTKFSNVILDAGTKFENRQPDFADIIYSIFRCSHLHGDEVPKQFSFCETFGRFNSTWQLSKDEIHMPDRVLWALIGVVVFCESNSDLDSDDNSWLSLGDDTFVIKEWWGKESSFKEFAEKYNKNRIEFKNLERLRKL